MVPIDVARGGKPADGEEDRQPADDQPAENKGNEPALPFPANDAGSVQDWPAFRAAVAVDAMEEIIALAAMRFGPDPPPPADNEEIDRQRGGYDQQDDGYRE